MSTDSFGDAMAKAEAVKETKETAGIRKQTKKDGDLSVIDNIKIVELSLAEKAERAEKAVKMKKQVEEAARKFVAIQATIHDLNALATKGPLSSESKGNLSSSKTSIKQIRMVVAETGCLDHFEKSVFLESIRRAETNADNVSDFMVKAIDAGHYRKVSGDEGRKLSKRGPTWSKGTLRYRGQFYLPCFDKDKSSYQMALEAELGKLIRRTVSAEKKVTEARLEEIRKVPTEELLGIKRRKPGCYPIYFPAFTSGDGRVKKSAGAVVVCIKTNIQGPKKNPYPVLVIEIVEGVGRCEWLNEHVGQRINYSWYDKQTIPSTVHNEVVEKVSPFAGYIMRKLYQSVGRALKAQRMARETAK